MSDLSLFHRNRIDRRVSALSASNSKLGPRLFPKRGSKKKIYAGFSRVEDTYQTYEGKSVNGSITRKYYYKNGQRCDVFGRTVSDVGHTPVIGIEKNRPISYPISNQSVNQNNTHPKKNFYKTWGLDSGLLLDINKSKLKSLSASDVNVSSLNLLRNLEKKLEDSRGKSKNIHFKIFNPRSKQISRLIVNDDVLWYHMNYPIQVPDFSIPEVSYKSLNLRDNIIDKFMSTN